MGLLLLSLLGGILTILSPCVLPLLPVIVGGSVTNHNRWRPVIITASLSVSVVLFTLALKLSTALISIPPSTWTTISGSLVVALGIITIFPSLWEKVALKFNLSGTSNTFLSRFAQKNNWVGAVLVGMALGPVFSSCSPTYALILATVLPQSFFVGLMNLIAYAIGLSAVLLLVGIFGQRIVVKLKWAANPKGWFKRALGILFIVVGLLIITGIDKKIETSLVSRGFGITNLEERLVNDVSLDMDEAVSNNGKDEPDTKVDAKAPKMNISNPTDAPELQGLQAWINSNPTTLEKLKGKVVLVDFWTYSCINCIRTLPFMNEWHEKYADDGLVILGIHSPEFAFEKVEANVRDAVNEYGIKYAVALDNEFGTWRAYSNRFWPAKYFIDREGKVRHTHFGEGEYEESEEVIRYLLSEGGEVVEDELGEFGSLNAAPISSNQTPETYLGYERASTLANKSERKISQVVDYRAKDISEGEWTLDGQWSVSGEHIVAGEDGASLQIQFSGKDVYIVAVSDEDASMEVRLNGYAPGTQGGVDVVDGSVDITGSRLYHIVSGGEILENNILELTVDKGVQLNAFTFGS